MIYFVDRHNNQLDNACFTWSHLSETQFGVCVESTTDSLTVSVVLPTETELDDKLLIRGASTVIDTTEFTNGHDSYAYALQFEGCDEEYSYTFEEIVEELWPNKQLALESIVGDLAIYKLQPIS